mgnify:CR=1 FL=1
MLLSCSTSQTQNTENIVGIWEVEECRVSFVHAYIRVKEYPKQDYHNHINLKFTLELTQDSKFVLSDEFGKRDSGTYLQSSDSIILRKGRLDGLTFKVNYSHPDTLNLYSGSIRLYDIEKDTLSLFTGDKVRFRLRRD